MEVIKVKISKDLYFKIPISIRDKMEIQDVEPDDFDYSEDEIWLQLRKESMKAYKKLKEREFNIRHNLL